MTSEKIQTKTITVDLQNFVVTNNLLQNICYNVKEKFVAKNRIGDLTICNTNYKLY